MAEAPATTAIAEQIYKEQAADGNCALITKTQTQVSFPSKKTSCKGFFSRNPQPHSKRLKISGDHPPDDQRTASGARVPSNPFAKSQQRSRKRRWHAFATSLPPSTRLRKFVHLMSTANIYPPPKRQDLKADDHLASGSEQGSPFIVDDAMEEALPKSAACRRPGGDQPLPHRDSVQKSSHAWQKPSGCNRGSQRWLQQRKDKIRCQSAVRPPRQQPYKSTWHRTYPPPSFLPSLLGPIPVHSGSIFFGPKTLRETQRSHHPRYGFQSPQKNISGRKIPQPDGLYSHSHRPNDSPPSSFKSPRAKMPFNSEQKIPSRPLRPRNNVSRQQNYREKIPQPRASAGVKHHYWQQGRKTPNNRTRPSSRRRFFPRPVLIDLSPRPSILGPGPSSPSQHRSSPSQNGSSSFIGPFKYNEALLHHPRWSQPSNINQGSSPPCSLAVPPVKGHKTPHFHPQPASFGCSTSKSSHKVRWNRAPRQSLVAKHQLPNSMMKQVRPGIFLGSASHLSDMNPPERGSRNKEDLPGPSDPFPTSKTKSPERSYHMLASALDQSLNSLQDKHRDQKPNSRPSQLAMGPGIQQMNLIPPTKSPGYETTSLSNSSKQASEKRKRPQGAIRGLILFFSFLLVCSHC